MTAPPSSLINPSSLLIAAKDRHIISTDKAAMELFAPVSKYDRPKKIVENVAHMAMISLKSIDLSCIGSSM